MLTEIALVFVLALCNGFFALSEMALVASRKSRLKQMARTSRRAQMALRHAEAPEHFLSTVQVGITFVMLVTGAVAGDALGSQIGDLLHGGKAAWLAPYTRIIGIALGFVLISFIQIVIGELVPKRLALSSPERASTYVAMPMLVLSRVAGPFVWLLNRSSGLLLQILRVNDKGSSAATEEEIRLLVAESTEQGVLDLDEQAMVNRVLRLGDRTVDSVMTPRMRIAWLDHNAPLNENLDVMRETPYSRYPVYRSDESDIAGVVEVKSLLKGIASSGVPDLFCELHKPLFVPATARALDLLEEFRDAETPMALVVDEYGEIEGIVTLNDLLAAVVGASQLGHGHEESHPIVQREDGSWLVDGALSTDDLRELLRVDHLPGESEHDFRTAAGMVMTALGHVPQTGEVLTWRGIQFEVVDLDGARIDKLLVSLLPQGEAANDA